MPSEFTAGIFTDLGELTAVVSAEELDFQTDGPIICQALFQRLAPQAPHFGVQINFAGDRLEVYFDPAYTLNVGGISFGTTSLSQGCSGSVMLLGPDCPADVNGDGFVNSMLDYDEFASAFEEGSPDADFNGDGFVNAGLRRVRRRFRGRLLRSVLSGDRCRTERRSRYTRPMTQVREPIGVVGFGHFGLFAGVAPRYCGDVISRVRPACAPGPVASRRRDDAGPPAPGTTIICCVPVRSLEGVLRAARPCLTREHLVLDVGSVKVLPPGSCRVNSVPASHGCRRTRSSARRRWPATSVPSRAVICPNTQHPAAADEARSLYERIGCEVIDQTPEEHDQLMAMTHALAFFVAKGMIGVGAGEDAAFVPPSFRAMKQTVDTVRVDAGHLFSVIQNDNPFAAAARRKLIDELEAIDADLRRAEGGTIKDLEIH